MYQLDVLRNDTDDDDAIDVTTVKIPTPPEHGMAVARPDGIIEYTPNAGFVGFDSFGYTVDDEQGARSNEAKVGVRVTDPNNPPAAVDDEFEVEGR